MKKTSLKTLEAQQKLFSLFGTVYRLRVINEIAVRGHVSRSDLTKYTKIDDSIISRTLKTLMAAGLVKRDTDDKAYSLSTNVAPLIQDLLETAIVAEHELKKAKPRLPRTVAEAIPLFAK